MHEIKSLLHVFSSEDDALVSGILYIINMD